MDRHLETLNQFTFDDGNDKFHAIRKVRVQNSFEQGEFSRSKGLCLVCCVWGMHEYIKFCLYSLMSQLAYSDIHKYDVRVFISWDLAHLAAPVLSRIVPIDKIMAVHSCLIFKYTIAAHPELKDFGKLVFCDCDGMILGEASNFYEAMTTLPNRVHMGRTGGDPMAIFKSRLEALSPSPNPERLFSRDFIEHIPTVSWFLSCMAVFDNTLFRDGYFEHCKEFLFDQFLCDETVWLYYFFKLKEEVYDLNEHFPWIHAFNYEEFLAQNDQLKRDVSGTFFLHPFEGAFGKNPKTLSLLNKIAEDYAAGLANVLD